MTTQLTWARLWTELKSSPLLAIAFIIVVVSIVLMLVGPLISPYDSVTADAMVASVPPSAQHWFGTDRSGMDIFSRVMAAPRVDVSIALVATFLSIVIGSTLGVLAGFYRGLASEVLMRIADVVQSFPTFILGMILVTLAGTQITNVVFVIAFLNTPIYLRLVRSQMLSLRERPYVEAARAIGARELMVAFRHVLPNALTPVIAQSSVTIGWAILLTAGLSFIGAGVRPPTPEWGSMISLGANDIILGEWWPSVFPGVAISVCVFGFAVLSDGLERMLDPRRQ